MAQEPSWDFLVPWAEGPPVLSFPLLKRGAREGSRAPLGSAPGCRLIYFYRDETVLSEFPSTPNRSLEGRACQWLPEAPAALGSVRSASWVWGRSSPRDAHLLVHSFLPSFIHSPRLVSGFVREAESRRSAAWSRPAPTSVQSGGSGRPVPRCPRPFSEHGRPSGRDWGQVVLSWPAVPRRGQGRRRPRTCAVSPGALVCPHAVACVRARSRTRNILALTSGFVVLGRDPRGLCVWALTGHPCRPSRPRE